MTPEMQNGYIPEYEREWDGPEPDQCCECDQQAVGHDASDGLPYCANHYRARMAFWEKPQRSPICETDCGDGSTVYDDRPRPGA